MREVHVFYAYDDTEFTNRDECLAYEDKARHLLWEIDAAYSFFDENSNLILPPPASHDIDEWFNWLYMASEHCEYVNRHVNLSMDAEMFYYDTFGFCFLNEDFNNELGMFRYNTKTGEWDKVDAVDE